MPVSPKEQSCAGNLTRGWQSVEQKSTSDAAVSRTGSQAAPFACFLRQDPQLVRLPRRNYDIYDCGDQRREEIISPRINGL